MKLRFLVASCLFALTTVASAADPQLLKLVMPDAKVVSGINVDQVKATPFGIFFLSQLPATDSQLATLISATGFDPRRDISEILMASPADPQKKSGLLLVRGTFDTSRILALVKAEGKNTQLYNGVEILAGATGKHAVSQGVAFLDNSTVVAGDLDSVRGAIDRRNATSTLDPALSAKIGTTSAMQDAWVVSIAPISSFAPVVPNKNVSGALQGDLIKAIQQSSGGVKFGNMIEVSGELTARTDQDASSLADVIKFFMNMAQTNAPSGQAAQLVGLLQNLNVNAQANAVKVTMSFPETALETLIKINQKSPRI